jgi:hypothetical protein
VQIADAPSLLTQNYLEFWIGASGGNDWGGCDVWFSTDSVTYSKIGTIRSKGVFGVLTANIATNAGLPSIDTTHTLAVDTTLSGGAIDGVSSHDFDAGIPLVWVDGEYLLYRDSSLTSAFHYSLTHLGRGAAGTSPASHSTSNPFLVCDGSIFKYPYPGGVLGPDGLLQVRLVQLLRERAAGSLERDARDVCHRRRPDDSRQRRPAGTVTVDPTGVPTIVVDGPGWVQSYKYLTSTSWHAQRRIGPGLGHRSSTAAGRRSSRARSPQGDSIYAPSFRSTACRRAASPARACT